MSSSLNTYVPLNSCIHRLDTRIKLLVLLVFSITTFMVTTWVGLGIFCCILLVVLGVSHLPLKHIMRLCLPLLVILVIIWVCNAFTLEANMSSVSSVLGGVSAGFAQGMPDIALMGTFGFSPEGAMRGAFYMLRIIVLFVASFIVVLSSTSNDLVGALNSLLGPLKKLRIPVDDIAMIFSLVLRFIPLIAEEALQIRQAQRARGAVFNQGSAWKRITAWFPVLIPLFVGLFRRAEAMSIAMDARCYGKGQRTNLVSHRLTAYSVVVLVVCTVVCVATGMVL